MPIFPVPKGFAAAVIGRLAEDMKLPLSEAKDHFESQSNVDACVEASGALKAVRTTIDAARGLLNGVNFGTLSTERKKAYNDAKLLMQQAEDALKEGNLAIAQGVANKAETLARELAGR